MRQAHVHGSVELRPVRLGLVIGNRSTADFIRAIQLASVCWGGRTFPIFVADQNPEEVNELALLLGIDALVACSDDPELVAWSEITGFRWFSLGGGGPLSYAEYGHRPVNIGQILDSWGPPPPAVSGLVDWNEAEEFDALFHVMFGKIASSSTDYEAQVHRSVSNRVATAAIGRESLLGEEGPQPWSGPLLLGMREVAWHGWTHQGGLAVVDPHSVDDLIALWNLRAIGPLVLPWPEPWDERIGEFTLKHLEAVARRDRPHDLFEVEVFAEYPDPEVPERLRAALGEDYPLGIGPLDIGSHIHLGTRISSGIRRRFEATVDVSRGMAQSMRVPLPPVEVGNTRPGDDSYVPQIAMAGIDVLSEEGMPEGVTFAPPPLRTLQPELRWTIDITADVLRATSDGPVVSVRWGDHDARVGPVSGEVLSHRLLERAGSTAATSDAGLWSARILELLGGARSSLMSQPAVRAVLEKCSREKGANTEELRGEIHRLAGAWRQHYGVWRRAGPSYPDAVLMELGARRVIEGRLAFTCWSCGLAQKAPAEEITDLVVCADCDASSALVTEIVRGAHWRLRTRSLLTVDRVRSIFPIGATLSLLSHFGGGIGTRSIPYALGVDLELGDDTFEIDFAAFIQDDRGPALVLGEAKAGGSFDEADVTNLCAIQEAVRALGVECFIAFAHSRDRLPRQDILLLREAADRGLWTIGPDRGRGSHLNLPLCLSREMLTQPPEDENHPLKLSMNNRWSLASLAFWTCEAALGLEGYEWPERTLTWGELPTE